MHTRRQLLGAGLHVLGGLCVGCRTQKTPSRETADSGPPRDCAPLEPGGVDEGWVEVPLAAYPELAEVGGQAAVSAPEALLEVVVAQPTEGCFIAVWRICTHGACDVTWEAEARALICPCHESRFAEDGQVLVGPATEPLASFPATRVLDSVWIYRPL